VRTRTTRAAAAAQAAGALLGWVTASGRLITTFAQGKSGTVVSMKNDWKVVFPLRKSAL
jgi:hypothetical protein